MDEVTGVVGASGLTVQNDMHGIKGRFILTNASMPDLSYVPTVNVEIDRNAVKVHRDNLTPGTRVTVTGGLTPDPEGLCEFAMVADAIAVLPATSAPE